MLLAFAVMLSQLVMGPGLIQASAAPAASIAANQLTVQEAIQDAAAYLLDQSTLGDWDAYALAKAGFTVPSFYKEDAAAKLQAVNGELTLVTDYARLVLALQAIGENAASFAGYNLINKLVNHNGMTKQGNNGVIFSLLALDSGNYSVPDGALWTRDKLVKQLLDAQKADGSWALGSGQSEIDLTANAVLALKPYNTDAKAAKAIEAAVEWLASNQLSIGGYNYYGENAETTAQVIIALSASGIDAKDGVFKKLQGDPLTFLFGFRKSDGGFAHLREMNSSAGVTQQALQALAAYQAAFPNSTLYDGERRQGPVPGEEVEYTAKLFVEGPNGMIAEGGMHAASITEGLRELLEGKSIPYELEVLSFGTMIKSIGGHSADNDKGLWWGYNVKRNGKWQYETTGNVGIDGFPLRNGDEIYVYYSSIHTKVIHAASVTPGSPDAGVPFHVKVEQGYTYWDAATSRSVLVVEPAAGAVVSIGDQKNTSDEQGNVQFAGMDAGIYTLSVSKSVYEGAVHFVRSTQPLVIGNAATVSVYVEGPEGPIAAGTADGVFAMDAIMSVLDEQEVWYETAAFSWGQFIKTIGNYSDNWAIAVMRGGEWQMLPVGMDSFELEDNDRIVLYYTDYDSSWNATTHLVSSAASFPALPKANEPISIYVTKVVNENFEGFVERPAAGVQVQLGGQKATTNAQGIAHFGSGLPKGSYTLLVTSGEASKVVRYELPFVIGSDDHVTVTIEGKSKTVVQGINGLAASGKALDALKQVLESGHIPHQIVNHPSLGLYVQSIKEDSDSWTFAVKRNKAWIFPQLGMNSFELEPGDEMLVYYGGYAPPTALIHKVAAEPQTPRAGQSFTMKVDKTYSEWDEAAFASKEVIVPAVGASVTIGDQTTAVNEQGIAQFNGLSIGSYPVIITGYVNDGTPLTVKSVSLLTVQPNSGGGSSATNNVTVDVVGDAAHGTILSRASVEFRAGDNPYTVLARALGQERVKTRGSGEALYVSGIDDLFEFDKGPESGWMYAVNCVFPGGSAGSYTGLKAGDRVSWNYSLDNGNDVKATMAASSACRSSANPAGPSEVPAAVNPQVVDLGSSIDAAAAWIVAKDDLSDWEAYALAQAGKAVPSRYLMAAEQYVKDNDGKFRIVTEYERMALGVRAAGGNPRAFAGIDLIEAIFNHERMTVQGTNGPVFALHVLQAGGYELPADAAWNRDRLVSWVLEQQNDDGGWPLAPGDESIPDMTAMALVSLSTLYEQRPEVKQAVDQGVQWLSANMNANGGYELVGTENSESTAQVVLALAYLGIRANDGRFVKDNINPLVNLLSYQNKDGGFSHYKGQPSTSIATEQSLLALASYDLMQQGKPLTGSPIIGNQPAPLPITARYSDEAAISEWALGYVMKARDYGLMEGMSVNDAPAFDPQGKLTRAQFIAIVLRLIGETPDSSSEGLGFKDVSPEDWHYGYAAKAVKLGITTGITVDQFAPDRSVSRQEMALMLGRALQLNPSGAQPASAFTDLYEAYPAAVPMIQEIAVQGYMIGDGLGKFNPQAEVTREMAAAAAVRAYEKLQHLQP